MWKKAFRLTVACCLLLLYLGSVGVAVDCDSQCREYTIFLYSSKTYGVYCVQFKWPDCDYCEWSGAGLCDVSLALGESGCKDDTTRKQQARYPTLCSNQCTLGTAPAASTATITKDSTDVFAVQSYFVKICPITPDG